MNRLSKTPIAAEYEANDRQKVKLGSRTVTVGIFERERRQGSYERGLKWATTRYGYVVDARRRLSFDHGATWHEGWNRKTDVLREMRAEKRKPFRLPTETTSEFAFDGIQQINRRYDPRFRWTP